MFESVNGQTDARTDGHRLESHPISSPRAFGSNELKKLDIRQSACLVANPITVYSYGFLFNCTTVDQASDSIILTNMARRAFWSCDKHGQ